MLLPSTQTTCIDLVFHVVEASIIGGGINWAMPEENPKQSARCWMIFPCMASEEATINTHQLLWFYTINITCRGAFRIHLYDVQRKRIVWMSKYTKWFGYHSRTLVFTMEMGQFLHVRRVYRGNARSFSSGHVLLRHSMHCRRAILAIFRTTVTIFIQHRAPLLRWWT